MATTLSTMAEIEAAFYAGDRIEADLIVIDAQGFEWAVITDEYDALHIKDEDEMLLLPNTETYYGPIMVGALESHGPFTVKD